MDLPIGLIGYPASRGWENARRKRRAKEELLGKSPPRKMRPAVLFAQELINQQATGNYCTANPLPPLPCLALGDKFSGICIKHQLRDTEAKLLKGANKQPLRHWQDR